MPKMEKDAIVTPGDDYSSSGGGASENVHQQWVMRSINDLKDDLRALSVKADTMSELFRQQSVSLERISASLDGLNVSIKSQNEKLEKLDSSLKDFKSDFSSLKNKFLGGLGVLTVIIGGVSWLFGHRLLIILDAVSKLH